MPIVIRVPCAIPRILRHINVVDYTRAPLVTWFWSRLARTLIEPVTPIEPVGSEVHGDAAELYESTDVLSGVEIPGQSGQEISPDITEVDHLERKPRGKKNKPSASIKASKKASKVPLVRKRRTDAIQTSSDVDQHPVNTEMIRGEDTTTLSVHVDCARVKVAECAPYVRNKGSRTLWNTIRRIRQFVKFEKSRRKGGRVNIKGNTPHCSAEQYKTRS